MSYQELVDLIARCLKMGGMDPDTIPHFIKAARPPEAASYAAEHLWVANISFEENRDTELLRSQLVHLKKTGMFDIDRD